MLPINNSDTAWLIVTDYNQDNNLYYEELREDIIDPEIDQWHTTLHYRAFSNVGGRDDFVGTTIYGNTINVGVSGDIGGHGPTNPSIYNVFGHLVGGSASR